MRRLFWERLVRITLVTCVCGAAAGAPATLNGCGSRSGGSADAGGGGGGVLPPATTNAATGRRTPEAAVIEAALVDLLTAPDEESEILRQEQGNGTLTFTTECREVAGTLRQELSSAALQSWVSLGPADRAGAKEASADVLARMASKEFFAPFRPKDRRIRVWQDDPASTRPAEMFPRSRKPRPIGAAPPGYGDGGRVAVVVFGLAWSIHGGDATYVLRFDGTAWRVVARHFTYYV